MGNQSTVYTRIQQAAQARGHTSNRSRSGVDVSAMAHSIGCSYEMARRYAEGLAVPPPETLESIAQWLRVNVAWLGFGTPPMEAGSDMADVDEKTLETCLEAVEEAQQIAGVHLSTHQAAHLVAMLFREARQGAELSAPSLAAAVRAFAS